MEGARFDRSKLSECMALELIARGAVRGQQCERCRAREQRRALKDRQHAGRGVREQFLEEMLPLARQIVAIHLKSGERKPRKESL